MAIQAAHDAGKGRRECQKIFGLARATWSYAIKSGRLIPRDHRIPLEELLRENSPHHRHHIKQRLLTAGILRNHCYRCGLTEWLGERISLDLDHVNGDKHDYRLENLRLLCPNCHAQTPTYCGRNVGRKVAPAVLVEPGRL